MTRTGRAGCKEPKQTMLMPNYLKLNYFPRKISFDYVEHVPEDKDGSLAKKSRLKSKGGSSGVPLLLCN